MSKRASEASHPTKVDWQIPLQGENGEWYPVVRVGRHVPFGYKQDEEDQKLFDDLMNEIKEYKATTIQGATSLKPTYSQPDSTSI